MSNITPIRGPMPMHGGPQHMHEGWMWDGFQWIWPDHPPCPPPQQCGPPSCMSAVAKAQACYDQSQSLYNLVSQVVSDIFAKNPGIIPAPPPSAGSGPILGVTDGSNAQPGEVGEYVTGFATANYAAGLDSQSFALSPIILQPGDWSVQAWAAPSTSVGQIGYYLSPVPPGLSNQLGGNFWSDGAEVGSVVSTPARAIITVPTLLAFTLVIEQGTIPSLPAGTVVLYVDAWRMR